MNKLERKEKIIAWWHEGKSSGWIAKELGISRNTVCGAVHRAGLTRHVLHPPKRLYATTVKKRGPKNEDRRRVTPAVPISIEQFQAEEILVEEKPPDKPPGVEMLDLRANQCKFAITPHQDRHHRFCGAPTRLGVAYCPEHAKLIHTPPRPRGRPPVQAITG